MVLGILGLFCFGLAGIGSLIGFILGIVAAVKASRHPNEYGGKRAAVAGMVLNGLIVFVLLPLTAAVAVPRLLALRVGAGEGVAMVELAVLASAEDQYQKQKSGGRGYATLDQLVAAGLLSRGFENSGGYHFRVAPVILGSASAPQYKFEAFATPQAYGTTGRKSFYISEDFVIRSADHGGSEATAVDPVVGGGPGSPSRRGGANR